MVIRTYILKTAYNSSKINPIHKKIQNLNNSLRMLTQAVVDRHRKHHFLTAFKTTCEHYPSVINRDMHNSHEPGPLSIKACPTHMNCSYLSTVHYSPPPTPQCVCVCVCVCACVLAYIRACVRAGLRACVRVCGGEGAFLRPRGSVIDLRPTVLDNSVMLFTAPS